MDEAERQAGKARKSPIRPYLYRPLSKARPKQSRPQFGPYERQAKTAQFWPIFDGIRQAPRQAHKARQRPRKGPRKASQARQGKARSKRSPKDGYFRPSRGYIAYYERPAQGRKAKPLQALKARQKRSEARKGEAKPKGKPKGRKASNPKQAEAKPHKKGQAKRQADAKSIDGLRELCPGANGLNYASLKIEVQPERL